MSQQKAPLYRKVNTKARGVHHGFGGDYKNTRHTKKETREQVKGTMHGSKERGLDYTPLFRFLLSKVGCSWNEVYSEAKARLHRPDPIFWMVAIHENEKKDYFCSKETSYFSGLYMDDNGILQITNPSLQAKDMKPFCSCCTHTFNGKLFGSV